MQTNFIFITINLKAKKMFELPKFLNLEANLRKLTNSYLIEEFLIHSLLLELDHPTYNTTMASFFPTIFTNKLEFAGATE